MIVRTESFIRRHYDSLAGIYDRRWHKFLASSHDWALKRLQNLEQGAAVLDLGCGTGRLLEKLGRLRPDLALCGMDASPAMLDIASARCPDARFIPGGLKDTRKHVDTGGFDAVLSLNVLHHLDNQDGHLEDLAALARIPDGRIILGDFAIDSWPLKLAEMWWRQFHPAHNRAFSSRRLAHKLSRETGLSIEEQDILRPDPFWRLQIYRLRASCV